MDPTYVASILSGTLATFSITREKKNEKAIADAAVGCAGISSSTVTPQFTQGSMQSNTTVTTNITRTINTDVYGGAYSSWSGTNVTPSGDITDSATTWSITTAGDDFQLETVTRVARSRRGHRHHRNNYLKLLPLKLPYLFSRSSARLCRRT